MLFKPSPRTVSLLRRGNWLSWPLWLGTFGYLSLRWVGVVGKELDRAFFPIFFILFLANFVHTAIGLNSARKDAARSPHPDPDVAALIDNEIDISEYRRRKESQSLPEQQASQGGEKQSDA